MARKRMISPEFWRDQKITELGFLERLIFIGLWTFAEDNGVGRADIELLMSDIFPRGKKPTLKQFADGFNAIAQSGMIVLYRVDKEDYYFVKNFNKYQTINRPTPSNLPLPSNKNEDSLNAHGGFNEDSRPREDSIREEEVKDKIIEDITPSKSAAVKPEISEIINYLNLKLKARYSDKSKSTVSHITARLKEGRTVQDFKTVIDKKCAEWQNDSKMCIFLRPETLFCAEHFDSYLNQPVKPSKSQTNSQGIDEADEIREAIRRKNAGSI